MQKLDLKTTVYGFDDGFRVDVVDNKLKYEAWIYHVDYAIKHYMFGIPQETGSDDEYASFLDMVIANFDGYREGYYVEVMDGDDGIVWND